MSPRPQGFGLKRVVRMKVVMFFYNPLQYDSRVLREASALARAGHEVCIICTRDGLVSMEYADRVRVLRVDREPLPAKLIRRLAEHRKRHTPHRPEDANQLPTAQQPPIFATSVGEKPLRLLRRIYASLQWFKYCRGALRAAARESGGLYVAHDVDTLPLAVVARAGSSARIAYDSHHLFTDRTGPDRSTLWRVRWTLIERCLIPRVDRVTTVSEPMARELSRRYGIPAPSVVPNFPERRRAAGHPVNRGLRDTLGFPGEVPVALYRGHLQAGRCLEQLILAATGWPELVVTLIGYGPTAYISSLHVLAARANVRSQLRFLPPVPREQLIESARGADVGIALVRDTGLNSRLMMSNKLFEYLAAGVPVVVSDWSAMAAIVEDHDVGVSCNPDEPDDVLAAIRRVVSDRERHRQLKHNALTASEQFSWEVAEPEYVQIINQLTVPGRP